MLRVNFPPFTEHPECFVNLKLPEHSGCGSSGLRVQYFLGTFIIHIRYMGDTGFNSGFPVP